MTSAPAESCTSLAKAVVNLGVAAGLQNVQLQAEIMRRPVQLAGVRCGIRVGRIDERRDNRCAGHSFMQQLQPFCHDGRGEKACACDIAAWPIEARDQAQCHRVATDGEDDWNGCSRGLCRQSPHVIGRKKHVHPLTN